MNECFVVFQCIIKHAYQFVERLLLFTENVVIDFVNRFVFFLEVLFALFSVFVMFG